MKDWIDTAREFFPMNRESSFEKKCGYGIE
jgi:hypothetical protein